MLEQMEALRAVRAIERVGRNATSTGIRKITGGSHGRLKKIMGWLIENGLVFASSHSHRANCTAVSYSSTDYGALVVETLYMAKNEKTMKGIKENDLH